MYLYVVLEVPHRPALESLLLATALAAAAAAAAAAGPRAGVDPPLPPPRTPTPASGAAADRRPSAGCDACCFKFILKHVFYALITDISVMRRILEGDMNVY